HDGAPDLFVGGRSVPRQYGSSPSSYLYVNDGKGHFTDIAATKNPDISNMGMVTGACWANISGGPDKDLVITGEWMSPRIFSFKKDHFVELPTNLSGLYGWWEQVAATDVNGDGKMDLILGNIGENFYLRPDSARPVKLWINDYDQNGNMDNMLSKTVDGKDVPVFLKHDLEFQMPILKKQNLKHGDFAKKTIQELVPEELLKTSLVKKFNYCPSVVAINQGNGQFIIRKLPVMVQLSSVNAIQCTDLNGDGYPDLILGGNEFGFLPQFGRLDGSFGDVLLNDGKGNFSFMENARSGLNLQGQVRDIGLIKGQKKTRVLFLINDEYPVLYETGSKK
ncbi:MAG TPA: RNA-binding protein, partial [Chitinophagaceae bacterium]|nr:RNA-binding protein [Chitinophagaceae bacterium]